MHNGLDIGAKRAKTEIALAAQKTPQFISTLNSNPDMSCKCVMVESKPLRDPIFSNLRRELHRCVFIPPRSFPVYLGGRVANDSQFRNIQSRIGRAQAHLNGECSKIYCAVE